MDLGSALMPAVTALLGSWAGASFALRRFKEERAFDRRLEWYERTHQALGAVRGKLWAAIHSNRAYGFNDATKAAFLAAGESLQAVSPRVDEADLYAPMPTVRLLY